jgi:hypothetical protein
MNTNLTVSIQWAIKLGILLSLAAAIIVIGQSSIVATDPLVATAVTIDLLFTIPIAYFFLIRRTSIPNITVAPVFFVCMLAASLILPEDGRGLLNAVAKFGVPAVEILVLGYLGFRLYRTRRSFIGNALRGRDVMERLRSAFVQELRPAVVARASAFEVSTFIYAFLKWRRPASGFTYHKGGSPVLMLLVFLFLLAAETFVLHVLLAMVSPTAAWIATAISIYFAVQIIAHLKALMLRPIVVTDDELLIRCGIFGDAAIKLEDIESVEKARQRCNEDLSIAPLGPLSKPNISVQLFEDTTVYGVYGIEKRVSRISFSVDEPDRFIAEVGRSIGEVKRLGSFG